MAMCAEWISEHRSDPATNANFSAHSDWVNF